MDVKQVEDPSKEVEELNKRLEASERRVTELSQIIAAHEDALAWRARQLKELELKLNAATTQLLGAISYMEGLQASFGWKLILRVRHFRDSLLPAGSWRRGLLEKIVGLARPRP
jgi:hypothetical protein